MKREWFEEFRDKLKNREKKSAPKVRKLLKSNYSKVAKGYSHEKTATEIADQFLTSDEDLQNVYRQIYKDVYVGMARWNVRKYGIQKSPFSDLMEYIQKRAFVQADLESFIKRGLIRSANRAAIVRTIERLRTEPKFVETHERAASKMLMAEFRHLSKTQAAMIVRTEATNAANSALLESTKRMFPGRSFRKEWLAKIDGRTRNSHRSADGQQVQETGQFFVGGELLQHPGGGKRPENNIFCRCAVTLVRNG